jgi:hypothetical protein
VIDSQPPVAPPPLEPPPPEPSFPPQPQEPADKTDQVAVADYLATLKTWQAQVNQVQNDDKQRLDAYQKQAEVYKAATIAYQQSRAQWQFSREAAVQPAEAMIDIFKKDFGWTFVNKNNAAAYRARIIGAWLAQAGIIIVIFGLILFLQKRKDMVR